MTEHSDFVTRAWLEWAVHTCAPGALRRLGYEAAARAVEALDFTISPTALNAVTALVQDPPDDRKAGGLALAIVLAAAACVEAPVWAFGDQIPPSVVRLAEFAEQVGHRDAMTAVAIASRASRWPASVEN